MVIRSSWPVITMMLRTARSFYDFQFKSGKFRLQRHRYDFMLLSNRQGPDVNADKSLRYSSSLNCRYTIITHTIRTQICQKIYFSL